MRRTITWYCTCGHRDEDMVADENDTRTCDSCHVSMQQDWWTRRPANAQWLTPVVLHVNNSPDCPSDVRVRYPLRTDAPLKAGYERIEIRSDRDMARFERSNRVLHHDRWFDRNGKGFDSDFRGKSLEH